MNQYSKGNKTPIAWVLLVISFFVLGLPLSIGAWIVSDIAVKEGENAYFVRTLSKIASIFMVAIWLLTLFFSMMMY